MDRHHCHQINCHYQNFDSNTHFFLHCLNGFYWGQAQQCEAHIALTSLWPWRILTPTVYMLLTTIMHQVTGKEYIHDSMAECQPGLILFALCLSPPRVYLLHKYCSWTRYVACQHSKHNYIMKMLSGWCIANFISTVMYDGCSQPGCPSCKFLYMGLATTVNMLPVWLSAPPYLAWLSRLH